MKRGKEGRANRLEVEGCRLGVGGFGAPGGRPLPTTNCQLPTLLKATSCKLRAIIILAVAASATIPALIGCATSRPATVYVASDRRIVSVTNQWGVACKAVPDAVFAEMLVKLEELKELKLERKVDARVGK